MFFPFEGGFLKDCHACVLDVKKSVSAVVSVPEIIVDVKNTHVTRSAAQWLKYSSKQLLCDKQGDHEQADSHRTGKHSQPSRYMASSRRAEPDFSWHLYHERRMYRMKRFFFSIWCLGKFNFFKRLRCLEYLQVKSCTTLAHIAARKQQKRRKKRKILTFKPLKIKKHTNRKDKNH
jgi:hypothetical protein